MTRRTKETKAGLKRQLKAMTENYDELETDRNEWRASNKINNDKLDRSREHVVKLRDDVHRLEVENAELHGYIKRVGMDDQERFLTNAGRKPIKKYHPDQAAEMVEYEGLYQHPFIARTRHG